MLDIRRLTNVRERLETRELKVNGTRFRVHLTQSRGRPARLWAERYLPAGQPWTGIDGNTTYGAPGAGTWVTVHDWR
jgi:hypothetical protein